MNAAYLDKSRRHIVMPEPTVRRLAHYKILLENLKKEGRIIVSSTMIADALFLDSIQVKKDIQYTGILGQPKKGYKVIELLSAIDEILNWKNDERAFLVGVGSLGKAVLSYSGFKACGLNFVAAFDKDRKKIGTTIEDIEVFDFDNLEEVGKMMKVNVGVITVPSASAQIVADRLIAGGVKAIWNFSACRLSIPNNIIIENAHFIQSLAILTHKLWIKQKINEIQ